MTITDDIKVAENDAIVTEDKKMFSYDSTPYSNHAFEYVSPEHMESIGTIFGTKPVDCKTARVLELGCGIGLTSVSFGARNPKATVVGIDMSKVQIEMGKKYVESLQLKNVELKAMSIMDIDKSFGEFDYIICHGVFAWVPKEVQDKILEIIQNHLSPNGLAHISYNTLPGWNIVQTFRDIMQYHAGMFETEQERLTQAYAFIQFMDEALEESNTPYSKFLKQELQILRANTTSYFLHEYLHSGNSQFYFSDFINDVAQYGLVYVGDASISSMYAGNLSKEVFEKLQVINNIVAIEQYMDFIINRRFRNTILCKANVSIARQITPNTLTNLYIAASLIPTTSMKEVNLENDTEELSFTHERTGTSISTSISISKVILYSLIEHKGKFISIDELTNNVTKILPKHGTPNVGEFIQGFLLEMLFKGMLEFRRTPPASIDKISATPCTSAIARYEVGSSQTNIINEFGNSCALNILQKLIVFYANGNNTIEQITDNILSHIEKGELTFSSNDKSITNSNTQKEMITIAVQETLVTLKNNYFLIG